MWLLLLLVGVACKLEGGMRSRLWTGMRASVVQAEGGQDGIGNRSDLRRLLLQLLLRRRRKESTLRRRGKQSLLRRIVLWRRLVVGLILRLVLQRGYGHVLHRGLQGVLRRHNTSIHWRAVLRLVAFSLPRRNRSGLQLRLSRRCVEAGIDRGRRVLAARQVLLLLSLLLLSLLLLSLLLRIQIDIGCCSRSA